MCPRVFVEKESRMFGCETLWGGEKDRNCHATNETDCMHRQFEGERGYVGVQCYSVVCASPLTCKENRNAGGTLILHLAKSDAQAVRSRSADTAKEGQHAIGGQRHGLLPE